MFSVAGGNRNEYCDNTIGFASHQTRSKICSVAKD